jgi:hypothetical protein
MVRLFSVKSQIVFLVAACLLAIATLPLVEAASARPRFMKTQATQADVLSKALKKARRDVKRVKHQIRVTSGQHRAANASFSCGCSPISSDYNWHCTCRWRISNCRGSSTTYSDGQTETEHSCSLSD